MGKSKKHLKKGEYQWSPEIRRITPLMDNHCYIQDDKGKLHHVKRDSDRFKELIIHLNEVMNGRIEKELNDLNWERELEILNAN